MEQQVKRKFSIGIPAFKSKFLDECIRSILSQTYPHFELIIINDCSPEPLEQIILSFNDHRILYDKNEKNTGAEKVVHNWNKCLEKATGDFFILMGDDDKMEPDYLKEFAQLIDRYPLLDVYHTRTCIINEASEPTGLTQALPEFETVYDALWHRLNFWRTQFISDFVYRTSALKQRGGFYYFPLAWASDDVTAYIACGTKGIAHINKLLFNYRISRYTISKTGNYLLKMDALMQEKKWLIEFLAIQPNVPQDTILHRDIVKKSDWYIRRKKIFTMHASVREGYVKYSYMWWQHRKKYGITIKELVYAIIGKF
jgi:glycosyltransferase involved in cell wall biosynthesis